MEKDRGIIIYRLAEGDERPSLSFKIKLLLALFRIPFVGRLFKKNLLRAYGLPDSTVIVPGFMASSTLLEVGENVSLADTFIRGEGAVAIGAGTSFSYRNTIVTATHDYNDWSVVYGKPVTIGRNCWITTNVTILPGVSIGDNTVIGAGSVVTKDIPSGVFAAGNPCRVIKEINFRRNE